jgi:excisionase family DNA binding protein
LSGAAGLTIHDLDKRCLTAGLTVAEVARRYRVSPDKVRAWIRRGELSAINTATPPGKARFVVLPHHLADFERRRAAAPPPKPQRRRRKAAAIDYFP